MKTSQKLLVILLPLSLAILLLSCSPSTNDKTKTKTKVTPVSIDEFTLDLLAGGSSIDGNHKIATNPPEATGTFSGSLPGGLTLNNDGSITGTPVHSVTATSGEDNDDMFTVTFTGSPAFGSTSKKILVKIYKYKPADKADLIRAIQIEMKADTGQGANADLNLIDTSAITNMSSLFNSVISNVFTGDVSKWDVSMVTNMLGMFGNVKNFNGDLSKWNVKNVKYMGGMFLNAYAFNGDISAWNVSKVENMGSMFSVARAFNQNISGWNVSSVTNMEQMFNNALAFNQDLTAWKDHIQTGVDVRLMFDNSKVTGALVPCWLDTSTDPDSVKTSLCK